MARRSTNVLAAAIATVLSFAASVAFGFYAAADDNIGAGFMSFVFLVAAVGSAIWCIVAFILYRRRRVEPRGFTVLTEDKGDNAAPPASGG